MLKHFSVFFLVLVAVGGYAQGPKRPMTFEDMMAMKRLGETAVSPDGKWLAYSVTTVDLEKNTKTPELWLQKIEGGEPMKIAVAESGDGGLEFAPDGKRILFTSSRDGSQQIWLADFDDATGATSNPKKLTSIATEADNAKWAPDGKSIVFTSAVYPDCAPINTADASAGNKTADASAGNKCNADRDAAAAASKVKAQIFTHLLYRHWNHYTGDKRSHLFIVSVENGTLRDLTRIAPTLRHRCLLAEYLIADNQSAEARDLLQRALEDYRFAPSGVRRLNRQWASQAKKLLKQVAASKVGS